MNTDYYSCNCPIRLFKDLIFHFPYSKLQKAPAVLYWNVTSFLLHSSFVLLDNFYQKQNILFNSKYGYNVTRDHTDT